MFGKGQVISTNRGGGIFQLAVDRGIEKLADGGWVHIFPEGYVNMTRKMTLRRFKWGVSRMILEAAGCESDETAEQVEKHLPVIMPIWITGFDQIMPEPRGWPRGLPRLGAKVGVHVGTPIDPSEIQAFVDAYMDPRDRTIDSLPTSPQAPPADEFPPITPLDVPEGGWPAPQSDSLAAQSAAKDTTHKQLVRSALAGFLRMKLANLGLEVRARKGDTSEGELAHRLMDAIEEERKIKRVE